ncbi:TorF family putative porin [Stenotrophomonas sp. YIM B06876]|uniref:TorF family putative porin n=1 Tax=Stenotrophomonas sp. YIM B06876 TaxID=3060211 RepID=UPI002738AF9C|nr:TorF family putative porin [Stenotrophomonas sp. YIM B06876]
MNHRKPLIASACALLLSVPFAVCAQEETASPISWEIGAVSDYLFRGVSQTDEKPTAQAGITWTAPFGLYAGGWASGVDFGDGSPDVEVDYFVGYGFDLNGQVNLDVLLNRYSYPGASELAYNELITTATFADTWKVSVGYTNDVFHTATDGWYYSVGGEWTLPQDFSIAANVGRSTFSDRLAAEADDYTDWNVSVGKNIGIANVSLGYFGTDGSGRRSFGKLADNRVVLSLKIAQ